MIYQRLLALLPPSPRHRTYTHIIFLYNLETGMLDAEGAIMTTKADTVYPLDPISQHSLILAITYNHAVPANEEGASPLKEEEDGSPKG